jgi:hypothetical protein|tara:strand:+ start:6374 stop:7573 length:1200 start_codon:yes stop_codon:yes gene_type:complete
MNNNSIYELDNPFDFNILNLGNPTLINNSNYSCKISHGKTSKNLYLQLPKCSTKQGIIKTASKTYADLNFCMSNKKAMDFFENLEKYCTEQIYNNRDAWLVDTDNLQKNDIDYLMQSTTRPFKHGKNFLVKVHINPDKLKIYDENENKIEIDEINDACEFIPLVNINNVKFSTKNFSIEIILTQMMVILPSDDFEKQVLIKVNSTKPTPTVAVPESIEMPTIETITDDDNDNDDDDNDDETINDNEIDAIKPLIIEDVIDESILPPNLEIKKEEGILFMDLEVKDEPITPTITEPILKPIIDVAEPAQATSEYIPSVNSNLETIDILNITESSDNSLELKSHEEIYLEIYNTAKQKAKDIRKNAITAFLEAKNIKKLYNLEELDIDSSDDEEDFMNFGQ